MKSKYGYDQIYEDGGILYASSNRYRVFPYQVKYRVSFRELFFNCTIYLRKEEDIWILLNFWNAKYSDYKYWIPEETKTEKEGGKEDMKDNPYDRIYEECGILYAPSNRYSSLPHRVVHKVQYNWNKILECTIYLRRKEDILKLLNFWNSKQSRYKYWTEDPEVFGP